jgi:ERCC4-type nuclease
MVIIIDSREPDDIQKIADKIKILQYGDICVTCNNQDLVLERKTPQDLVQSLFKGRLNYQLLGSNSLLIDIRRHGFNFDKYFSYSDNYDNERFVNILNGISTHHNIYYFLSIPQLENFLKRIENKMELNEFGKVQQIVVKEELPVQVRILSQYPGIGVKRAKLLLRRYKSISGVEDAAAFMETCDGIGPDTLSKIDETRRHNVNI